MAHNYSFQGYEREKMARVIGKDLPISTKQCIEICSFIKGRNLQEAKDLLEEVLKMKKPVPFKRFTEGAGHKKGRMAGGKYPLKASAEIIELLNSLEANAMQKGLNTSALVIRHACANRASKTPRYGRIRGITAKRTHVEFVAVEAEEADKKNKAKEKSPKPTEAKAAKKEEPKEHIQKTQGKAAEKPHEKAHEKIHEKTHEKASEKAAIPKVKK